MNNPTPEASPAPVPQGAAPLTKQLQLPAWLSMPTYCAAILSLLLIAGHTLPAAKFFSEPTHYLPLHTLLEFFAVAVSFMVFGLTWSLRRQSNNRHQIILGCGFLAVALVDMAHTLSYAGMPVLVTPSGAEKAINFWLAGRYIAAITFLAVAFLKPAQWTTANSYTTLLAALGLASITWWIGLFHAENLPRTFIPGEGLTGLKIGAEYLVAGLYGLAAILIYRKARQEQNEEMRWLAAAAWVQGLAEMFFTLYTDVTDLFNLLGHLYKVAAYVMVYRALFSLQVRKPYLQLDYERSQFRALFSTIPAPVWLKDPNGAFLACNPAFERMVGAKEAEIQGKTDFDFTDRATAEFYRANDRKAVASGSHCTNEETLKFASDGYEGIFETTKTPMYASNSQLIGVLGIAHDITERKQLLSELETHRANLEKKVSARTHELLVARDAADAANRAKSTFLSNMSHELRTPMNGVMGMIELALRRAVDPVQADQLSKAKKASQHLMCIINDILDLSKIDADRLQLEQTEFRLGEALENLVSMMGPQATQKGLRLLVHLDEGLPKRHFLGDLLRLEQVLLNLVGNALKFTERGSISINASLIEEGPEIAVVRWEVTDTGIGIDPKVQDGLFDAFQQADNSTTRKYGGTGLGLAISQRLVHLMGGEIGFASQPKQGSTFWFTIRLKPCLPAAVAAHPEVSPDSAEARLSAQYCGALILLAEDEPINQEVSRDLLERAGLLVDVANDGKTALALARQKHYAAILMDMRMPNLNGVDATRAIRADSLNSATPILAMTANAFSEDKDECLQAGMNDHIAKPVDPEVLYKTLLRWLEQPEKRFD